MTAVDHPANSTDHRQRRPSRWSPPLIAGVVAAPLFVVLILVQAVNSAGFELAEHPLSLLALGDNGWIQTGNFIVCGSAFVAAALTERRTTNLLTRWTSRMIVTFGAALIAAGVLQADPWRGYPVGATETITWHGVLHNIAAAAAGIALVVATITATRAARRVGHTTWAAVSITAGAGYVVLSITGSATTDFRVALTAGALIWCWASVALATTQIQRTPWS